jgi:2Fe-2S ferredoxin
MTNITFIEPDGTKHVIDAEPGLSLMEVALNNGISGIDADCGGMCACATCHVYIDPGMGGLVEAPSGNETDMLEFTAHRQPTSRLSCQVIVNPDWEGLVVRLPECQH